jgi:hypothetical protein
MLAGTVYAEGLNIEVFESTKLIKESMPSYLPITLRLTAITMIVLAVLLAISARNESRIGLCTYSIASGLLLVRLTVLIIEINYSTLTLTDVLSLSCSSELLPFVDQTSVATLACENKYT